MDVGQVTDAIVNRRWLGNQPLNHGKASGVFMATKHAGLLNRRSILGSQDIPVTAHAFTGYMST